MPYEKVGKNEPVCIANEVPFDIPDSWEWVRISTFAKVVTKGTTPRGGNVAYHNSGIGFLRAENVVGLDQLNLKNLNYIDEETHTGYLKRSMLEADDVLITIAGTLGRTGIVKESNLPLNANQAVAIIRLVNANELNLKYLTYALNAPLIQKMLTVQKKITAIPNLTLEIISDCLIPLPPIVEQDRIVSKISLFSPLFASYEETYIELTNLNTQFPNQLKKSILQEAVQGKLVPQDPNDEPASMLLERIRVEKQKLIKEGKIKKDKHESVIFRRDNSHYEKRGAEVVCIDNEIPFEIPDSWEWVRLKSICTKLVDGDHNPPKGENFETRYIMASSTNINSNRLVELNKVRYLSKEVFEQENLRTNATDGDLFFTSVGSLGRSCVYGGGYNICFQRSVSVITTLIYNYYLKLVFDSAYFQNKVIKEATGTAQKGFYLNQLAETLIPVAPMSEQKQIVNFVNKTLSTIEAL